jgi:hypothetical protein
MRAIAILMVVLLWAETAAAKEKAATALGAIDEEPPGEDAEVYRCGKAKGDIAVTFKPATELADLVAWGQPRARRRPCADPARAARHRRTGGDRGEGRAGR